MEVSQKDRRVTSIIFKTFMDTTQTIFPSKIKKKFAKNVRTIKSDFL